MTRVLDIEYVINHYTMYMTCTSRCTKHAYAMRACSVRRNVMDNFYFEIPGPPTTHGCKIYRLKNQSTLRTVPDTGVGMLSEKVLIPFSPFVCLVIGWTPLKVWPILAVQSFICICIYIVNGREAKQAKQELRKEELLPCP